MNMKAGLVAGGSGTRFLRFGYTGPKPLFPVAGIPLAERIILTLQQVGISEVIIAIGDKSEVKLYLSQRKFKIPVKFVEHDRNLGEAFFLLSDILLKDRCDFFFSFSDLLYSPQTVDFFFQRFECNPCDLFVGVSKQRVCDYKVQVDANHKVTRIGHRIKGNYYGVGFFICSPSIFCRVNDSFRRKFKHFLDFMNWSIKQGFTSFACQTTGVIDIDTPEDVRRIEDLNWVKNFLDSGGRS